MPIIAVVCSAVGLCLFPVLVVGVVLGVVSLVQKKGSQALAIIAVVLPVLWLPILAAIAIPNFIKFQSRSKQSEVRANLRAAFTAQKAFFDESKAFSLHPQAVGFSPEMGNRYLYAFALTGPIEANASKLAPEAVGVGADTTRFPTVSNPALLAAIPPELARSVGVVGQCPDCVVTLVAAGNIDNDETIDVWSISSADRPGAVAGTPFNDVSDVTD
jgi:type IV pilus assembly protein PilA